jgi:hypothetical protein
MQCAILWVLGRECFGIKPARPLRSLLIQAENDDGDLAEMRDGVIAGLELTPEETKAACDNITVVQEDSRTGVAFTACVVRTMLDEHRPDLVWIDPALAYLGGESNSQQDVGSFLRNLLNPLLHEFKCGAVVVHHTNKPPTGKEKGGWSGGDFAYLGSGSAEWANWARAVIAMRSIGSHQVFELRAAKRGRRLRWREADGETPAYSKLIAHSKTPGAICWREAEESERPEPAAKGKRVPTKADILPHVPVDRPIPKNELKVKANMAGIAQNSIYPLIEELIKDGKLHNWSQKRPRTGPLRLVARYPQPPEELLQ